MSTPEEIEGRVRAALDELGIAGWEWIDLDPQYGDTADFCEQYGYDLPHSANTIIVASKRGPAVYCAGSVRACDRLDVNKRTRGLMGVSRASFASAEETREVTGMIIGGVTALTLPRRCRSTLTRVCWRWTTSSLEWAADPASLKWRPKSWRNFRVWRSSRGCRFRRNDSGRFGTAFRTS